MVDIAIKIPDAAFNSGGKFYGQDRTKVKVPLYFNDNGPTMVSASPIGVPDWYFHPPSVVAYHTLLEAVNTGLIEILVAGAPQTVAQIQAIYQAIYPEGF